MIFVENGKFDESRLPMRGACGDWRMPHAAHRMKIRVAFRWGGLVYSFIVSRFPDWKLCQIWNLHAKVDSEEPLTSTNINIFLISLFFSCDRIYSSSMPSSSTSSISSSLAPFLSSGFSYTGCIGDTTTPSQTDISRAMLVLPSNPRMCL